MRKEDGGEGERQTEGEREREKEEKTSSKPELDILGVGVLIRVSRSSRISRTEDGVDGRARGGKRGRQTGARRLAP